MPVPSCPVARLPAPAMAIGLLARIVAVAALHVAAGPAGTVPVLTALATRACLPSGVLARATCLVGGHRSVASNADSGTDRLVDDLARRANRRPPRLHVVAGDGVEAHAMPGGPFGKRPDIVLVSEGLLALDARERAAVLAHELGHLGRRHVPLLVVVTLAATLSLLAALLAFAGHGPALARFERFGLPAALAADGFLVAACAFGLARLRLASWFERDADAYAVALLGSADGLIAALRRRRTELDRPAARALVDERLTRLSVDSTGVGTASG